MKKHKNKKNSHMKISLLPELSMPRLQLINYKNITIIDFGEITDISTSEIYTTNYLIKGMNLIIDSIENDIIKIKGEIHEIKITKNF